MKRKRRCPPPRPLPEGFSLKEAKRLYLDERWSLVRVGTTFGITEPTITKLFRAKGVPIRTDRRGRAGAGLNHAYWRRPRKEAVLKAVELLPFALRERLRT